METKDIVSVGFSSISLILSIGTLYLTQFRPPNVTVSTGPMIHIFYVKPEEPTIFLPVVFHNASPTKAIVYKAFLELTDTKGQHFTLKWMTSVKIDLSNNYTDIGASGPFKIDGYETIPNALRFFWYNANGGPQLDWLEGDYSIELHLWTSSTTKPTYSGFDKFHIDNEVAKLMAQKKAASDNTSRFFPLSGKSRISIYSGTNPVDFREVSP
jgi:hypothetical protein